MRHFILWVNLLLLIITTITQVLCNDEITTTHDGIIDTALAYENDDRLLVFATLDGNLFGVEKETGRIRWKIEDKPIVQVPVNTKDAIIPIFLPDPRDGSLYLLGANKEPIKKLPFTIPQLVASSPCRSSDGILYTGKKKDSWFKLDPKTGIKQQILGWDTTSSTCPIDPSSTTIFIGRTKYDIMMVDSHNSYKKWNVTFYDYTATQMSKDELNNYEFVHFASSSTGRLVTMDRRRGNLLWELDLNSPIVAAYLLDNDGLLMAPFTSLSNHTLNYLTNELITNSDFLNEQQPYRMKLYPTLYVGDHRYGLYALPSLVDQNVVTITASDVGPLLLGGPNGPTDLPRLYHEYPLSGYNYRLPDDFFLQDNTIYFQSIPKLGEHLVIFIGHYNVPKYSDMKFLLNNDKMSQVIPTQPALITDANNIDDNRGIVKKSIGIQVDVGGNNNVKKDEIIKDKNNESYINVVKFFSKSMYRTTKLWINQQENKGLKLMLIILFGCVIAMFWYLQIQVREFQNLSQNSSKSSLNQQQNNNTITTTTRQITAFSEELPNGIVRVGKITFRPNELLGKGCEGTFVYRGEFDKRQVAVKRLLPECFTFADREVALLRESDTHPNVIRYYCMEQDRLFCYIALELCQATLNDYINGKCDRNLIKPLEILKQATSGLAHLHSLDIVHRDIKPQNVLLSMPNNQGYVKAMISDFGLCKKLQVGKVSFSRRSGVTGTDGWIAPEMLNSNERTTCAVDLFSLGCLYYYVLSNGYHPFGDALRRQANILIGDYNLDQLSNNNDDNNNEWEVYLQKILIVSLISSKPNERPSCLTILQHPIFWDRQKILMFFQDVSDRIEKSDNRNDDIILKNLERNHSIIVGKDWRYHIHNEIATDIKKYRSYRGESVRHLLRALRNKKHHFRELSKEAQDYLGEIPINFTNYWLIRFPLLLIHTWLTMQYCLNETTFQHYYDKNYCYSFDYFNEIIINEYYDKNFEKFSKLQYEQSSPNRYFNNNNNNNNDNNNNNGSKSPMKNVGLYRNLDENFDIKKTNWRMSNTRKKRSSSTTTATTTKRDEPLVWSIKD